MNELVLSDAALTYKDQVGTITITRKDKLNALNSSVLEQLYQCFEAAEKDGDIRVIILKGDGGKAFAAGADLKEITEMDSVEELRDYYASFNRLYSKMASVPKPIIAQVEGYAFGGGCLLALACDMIVAGKNALFSQPEVNFGFTGGAALFTRLVGKHKAAELTMLAKNISAEEAKRLNLVSEVVENEDLEKVVEKITKKLLTKDQFAIAYIKKIIYNSLDSGLRTANFYEDECSAVCLSRPESKELILSFLNK